MELERKAKPLAYKGVEARNHRADSNMVRSLVRLNQEYGMGRNCEKVLWNLIMEFSCLGILFVGRENQFVKYLLCLLGTLCMLYCNPVTILGS